MLARRLNLDYTVANEFAQKGQRKDGNPYEKDACNAAGRADPVLRRCRDGRECARSGRRCRAGCVDRPDRQRPADRGHGFQFYIPADWEAAELTDEETEAGYVFAAASADEANQLIITYQALDAAKTAEEVQPGLAEVYPTATVMDLNGTSVVAFHDADEDVLGIVVMDTVDPGYYIFMFTPASDADFLPVADAIAASYTAAQ